MKPSALLAVLLSVLLPGGAFAGNLSDYRAQSSASSGQSVSVQAVPQTVTPLSPSIDPSSIQDPGASLPAQAGAALAAPASELQVDDAAALPAPAGSSDRASSESAAPDQVAVGALHAAASFSAQPGSREGEDGLRNAARFDGSAIRKNSIDTAPLRDLGVPRSGLKPSLHESRRYLEGRVYDSENIAREKADGRFTAVFDLNDTLEHHDDNKDPDAVHLRPGVEKDLARLRESGAKVVLWSQAEKWWTDKFFDKFPGIAPQFDRIITSENYMGMTAAEKLAHPATAARVAADPSAKDLSVLGYDAIVDDRDGLSKTAGDAGFPHMRIPPLRPGDAEGQKVFSAAVEEVLTLAKLHGLRQTPDGDAVSILDLKKDRALIQSSLGSDPLVFAINRSIFTLDAGDSGVRISRSAGGAAPAIYRTLMSQGGGIVFAAAMTPAEKALARYGKIIRIGDGAWLRYIDVPADVFDKHYAGFSNSMLWPVQHGMAEEFASGPLPDMRAEFEEGYSPANALFAREISGVLGGVRGRLMIQDYHLYLLPALLRSAKGAGVIQQFVHIPWSEPSYVESHIPAPVLREVLEGILGNDIVGFQTQEFAVNFMNTVRQVLGAEVDLKTGIVKFQGREIWVKVYPISIDVEPLVARLKSPESLERVDRLLRQLDGRKLSLRVERIDPTKGIVPSLEAFRRRLTEHPELAGKEVFYGIFQPSRDSLDAYRDLQKDIRRLVREINAKFAPQARWDGVISNKDELNAFEKMQPRQIPVVVAQMTGAPHDQVMASMLALDYGVVTPRRDGMNLVVKEMAIAADPRLRAEIAALLFDKYGVRVHLPPGVIVGSEEMGAAVELGPFMVRVAKPVDSSQVFQAMNAAALGQQTWAPKAIGAAEQVRKNDLKVWIDAMLRDIQARAPPARPAVRSWNWTRIAQTLTAAGTVAFLLIHIPQIWSNVDFLLAGHPEKLSSLPWIAYTIGIFNNLLLLFDMAAQKAEPATGGSWAVRTLQNVLNRSDILMQLSGVVMATLVLSTLYAAHQMAAPGSDAQSMLMPGWAFWGLVPVLAAGLSASYLKLKDRIGDRAWTFVNRGTDLLVLSSLTQAFWTLATGSFASLLPAALAAVAGAAWLGLESAGRLPGWMPKAVRWKSIMHWTRLAVAAYGLPALAIQNWTHPQNIAGVSLPSLMMGMWGNLLSLPKAILSKNKIFIFNSVYGGIVGSGLVLALMWYFGALGAGAFAGIGALAAAFVAVTLWQSRRHKN